VWNHSLTATKIGPLARSDLRDNLHRQVLDAVKALESLVVVFDERADQIGVRAVAVPARCTRVGLWCAAVLAPGLGERLAPRT
jgi:hypothetical protein